MARSPLFGRRIHISGSIAQDPTVASKAEAEGARELIAGLVQVLMKRGANFVVPVDAEPVRESDGLPICFDWLIWRAIKENLMQRPSGVLGPVAIAVQHHKTEDQIPESFATLWDDLRGSPQVQIENAAFWNMACKRMEAQSRFGDILVQ